MNNNWTIFLDIDGCILEQKDEVCFSAYLAGEATPKVLGNARRKLMDWHKAGHKIILTTGRTEPYRAYTEKVLMENGLIYDQLIMGLGPGPRLLINDTDPKDQISKAVSISPDRNEGIDQICPEDIVRPIYRML